MNARQRAIAEEARTRYEGQPDSVLRSVQQHGSAEAQRMAGIELARRIQKEQDDRAASSGGQ